ncbi:uncharacterized protein N7496_008460 [Penicillium cataractarum]|uniref:Uncharacterized protein n=1 Tax=Penicillium cataractarum TaxID=2100454 RepID=A0A9W9RZQ7_9EURO|nr:uncharacterized protein N7496_008460 [Penicillium cataractarum]KAJ5368700.1 hypothetical protein N7496_008460 [Penicillium cataractarum]
MILTTKPPYPSKHLPVVSPSQRPPIHAIPKKPLLDKTRLIAHRLKHLWSKSPPETNAYPIFPPTPEELLAKPSTYLYNLPQRIYRAPRDQQEDSPLFSLYRLYEHLPLNYNTGLRKKLEYFWYTKWPVSSFPDPKDQSKSRYALLSGIPGLLVESFNERIQLGLPRKADCIVTREELGRYQREERGFEVVTEWTRSVRRLEGTLVIRHEDGEVLTSFQDERVSEQLAEKTVLY